MNAATIPAGWPVVPSSVLRRLFMGSAYLCLVAGSQLGMLCLAEIYLRQDRFERITSPEAVAGIGAIMLAFIAIRLRSQVRYLADPTWMWLLGFLLVAATGEVWRSGIQLASISPFVSIGAYYLIGRAVGRDFVFGGDRIPILRGILAVYTVWYVWILFFIVRGDLGFYDGLTGAAELQRLQFRQGFTATEIPIYVGLQVPILIWTILSIRSKVTRAWATILLCSATALLVASVSAAALAATALVIGIFVVGRIVSFRSLLRSLGLIAAAALLIAVLGDALIAGLRASVMFKLNEFLIADQGRALIYATLINDIIQNPFGIGAGRFMETLFIDGTPIVPHNNVLGIAAELGVPAMLFYVGFICTAIFQLGKVVGAIAANATPSRRMIAAMGLAVFAYQQSRGLLQDTWLVREMYLWIGVVFGILSVRRGCHAMISCTLGEAR